jgi:KUP system potassium uptake protein
MADGVFTPAISVTSAVGGIAVAKPSASHDITAISIVGSIQPTFGLSLISQQGFLIVLFFVQQFGTHRLAFAFSPGTFRDSYNAASSDTLT